jgi:nicotinamide-nucleotide amidase
LQLDPDALEYIRRMFASRKRSMPTSNELQAMFPAGSRVVRNPHGTAPGIDVEVAREGQSPCRVICLPGVPAEMVEMWHDSVAATIAAFIGGSRRVIRRRLIHCFGAGESQLEAMLPDLIRRGRRPTVGITASKATITLRITADGATEEECLAAIAPVEVTIRQCLGTLIFGEGDDELQDVVVRLLKERGKTLATAECGTAGLMAAWLSEADDAGVFRGGFVLAEAIESAEAMATRCREQFHADYGLAIRNESAIISVALAGAEGIESKTLPDFVHPALSHLFRAKQALNFLRLRLLA